MAETPLKRARTEEEPEEPEEDLVSEVIRLRRQNMGLLQTTGHLGQLLEEAEDPHVYVVRFFTEVPDPFKGQESEIKYFASMEAAKKFLFDLVKGGNRNFRTTPPSAVEWISKSTEKTTVLWPDGFKYEKILPEAL